MVGSDGKDISANCQVISPGSRPSPCMILRVKQLSDSFHLSVCETRIFFIFFWAASILAEESVCPTMQ